MKTQNSEMKEVPVRELSGIALDWLVDAILTGKALEVRHNAAGNEWIFVSDGIPYLQGPEKFSSDWSKGGPLIENEEIGILRVENESDKWGAVIRFQQSDFIYGPTALIAAMRCYVFSKRARDMVEVPNVLLQCQDSRRLR